jgi:hypothetical protein
MGNYHPISIKNGIQTKTEMLSSKITEPEMQAEFQDGRRRHLGQSSARYKMGNYHPNLMKIGSQTKTGMLRSKVTKRKCAAKNCKLYM